MLQPSALVIATMFAATRANEQVQILESLRVCMRCCDPARSVLDGASGLQYDRCARKYSIHQDYPLHHL